MPILRLVFSCPGQILHLPTVWGVGGVNVYSAHRVFFLTYFFLIRPSIKQDVASFVLLLLYFSSDFENIIWTPR